MVLRGKDSGCWSVCVFMCVFAVIDPPCALVERRFFIFLMFLFQSGALFVPKLMVIKTKETEKHNHETKQKTRLKTDVVLQKIQTFSFQLLKQTTRWRTQTGMLLTDRLYIYKKMFTILLKMKNIYLQQQNMKKWKN